MAWNKLLRYLGDLSYFLGIEVLHPPDNSLFLHQTKYVQEYLAKANMSSKKTLPTPMSSGVNLSSRDGASFKGVTLYRSTVGALKY